MAIGMMPNLGTYGELGGGSLMDGASPFCPGSPLGGYGALNGAGSGCSGGSPFGGSPFGGPQQQGGGNPMMAMMMQLMMMMFTMMSQQGHQQQGCGQPPGGCCPCQANFGNNALAGVGNNNAFAGVTPGGGAFALAGQGLGNFLA